MISDPVNTGDREAAALPRRRPHIVIAALVGPTRVHLGIGTRPDGKLREIFVDVHKEGGPVRALFHLIAQLTSIGLRAGVPMSAIVRAFRTVEADEQVVEDHETITSARSIPDFIGQVLAEEFPEAMR